MDRPDATFTLDIRLYDGGCPKLSPGNGSSLPACTIMIEALNMQDI